MYIYQNGKLYVQLSGNKIVGVEIYPHETKRLSGTETILGEKYQPLTKYEVFCKFNIEHAPYIFPREEVKEVEPIINIKKPVRKYNRK